MHKTLAVGALLLWLTGCSAPPPPEPSRSPSSTPSKQTQAQTPEQAIEEIEPLLKRGNYGQVQQRATAALEKWPDTWKLIAQRGAAEQAMGQVKEAEADLTAAIKLAPKEETWGFYESRAIVRMQLGHNKEAEQDFAAASKGRGGNVPPDRRESLLQLRGRNLLEWGKYKEAVQYFSQALSLDSADHEALGMRALCYYRLKDKKKYQADLETLRKVNRTTADALELQVSEAELSPSDRQVSDGISYLHNGNNELALARFDRAIELNPKNAEAWRRKGVVLQRMEKYAESLAAYTKSYELDKNEAALFGRASCYQKMGDKAKAHDDFERYVKVGTNKEALEIARRALTEK